MGINIYDYERQDFFLRKLEKQAFHALVNVITTIRCTHVRHTSARCTLARPHKKLMHSYASLLQSDALVRVSCRSTHCTLTLQHNHRMHSFTSAEYLQTLHVALQRLVAGARLVRQYGRHLEYDGV